MIVLLGESASGKTTLEKMLCDRYGLRKITSYTTRPMRPNETDGVDYHFLSEEAFMKKLENHEFAEHYTAGNRWQYAIAREDCTDDRICVLTPEGLRQVQRMDDMNITSVYIKSARQVREERLARRGDDPEEIRRRFITDAEDFKDVERNVTHVVDNDGDIEDAFQRLQGVLGLDSICWKLKRI